MRYLLHFSVLCFLLIINTAADQANKIQWLTIEQAEAKMANKPKKIFVDLYTDWCGWCKVMDRNTFTHPKIIELMNKHFYAVKFDAESKGLVTFNGKEYAHNPRMGRSGTHNFASTFGRSERGMSYPTTLYFTENKELMQAVPGYLEAHVMEQILTYFGEDYPQRGVSWEQFQSTFKSTIPKEKR